MVCLSITNKLYQYEECFLGEEIIRENFFILWQIIFFLFIYTKITYLDIFVRKNCNKELSSQLDYLYVIFPECYLFIEKTDKLSSSNFPNDLWIALSRFRDQ